LYAVSKFFWFVVKALGHQLNIDYIITLRCAVICLSLEHFAGYEFITLLLFHLNNVIVLAFCVKFLFI